MSALRSMRSFSAWRRPPPGWLMVALKGYFDNSGYEDDAQLSAISVGGYLAPCETWDSVELAWRAALGDVPFLHMTDLKNRTGPYSDWPKNDEREPQLLAGLAGATKGLEGFGAVVPIADMDAFNAITGARVNPMAFAIYATIFAIRSVYPNDGMEIIFDHMNDGHRLFGIAQTYVKSGPSNSCRKFPNAMPLTDDSEVRASNTPALQAADFLAWELRKSYENKKEWFHREPPPSLDAPGVYQDLWRWFLADRSAHLKKHGMRSTQIPWEPHRRSLIALDSAAVIRSYIWDRRALELLHQARGGVWR